MDGTVPSVVCGGSNGTNLSSFSVIHVRKKWHCCRANDCICYLTQFAHFVKLVLCSYTWVMPVVAVWFLSPKKRSDTVLLPHCRALVMSRQCCGSTKSKRLSLQLIRMKRRPLNVCIQRCSSLMRILTSLSHCWLKHHQLLLFFGSLKY